MSEINWDELADCSAKLAHAAKVMDTMIGEAHADASNQPNPLPAPAPTEDAIVAALKADPAMAGRVMAAVAYKTTRDQCCEMGKSAREYAQAEPGSLRPISLQSLAVALAAASYRG